jgi:hypothetical protein
MSDMVAKVVRNSDNSSELVVNADTALAPETGSASGSPFFLHLTFSPRLNWMPCVMSQKGSHIDVYAAS